VVDGIDICARVLDLSLPQYLAEELLSSVRLRAEPSLRIWSDAVLQAAQAQLQQGE